MDDLQKLTGYNNILKTKLKIQLSLADIMQNNKHRSDLINSMNESIIDLEDSSLKWRFLEKECDMLKSLNNSLTLVNLKQIKEIEDLKAEMSNQNVNVEYINHLELENKRLKDNIDKLLND